MVLPIAPGTYGIDTNHSQLGFAVIHLGISTIRGTFDRYSGALHVGEDLASTVVTVDAEMESINSGNRYRDEHMFGADFFDTANHPQMAFRSTSIVDSGSGYAMTGDLTIKGVTKSVEFALEFDGVATDPWGNTKAGFTAEAEINRKDFGLEWNVALEAGGVVVGEKVKIVLEIEALQA